MTASPRRGGPRPNLLSRTWVMRWHTDPSGEVLATWVDELYLGHPAAEDLARFGLEYNAASVEQPPKPRPWAPEELARWGLRHL